MRNRRPVVAGLALVALLGLTACDNKTTASSTGSGAAAEQVAETQTPAAELSAAAEKLSGETFKISMESAGTTMSGVADGTTGDAQMSMDASSAGTDTTIEVRKVGTDLYMKFGGEIASLLGGSGKEWMHIDAGKMSDSSAFNLLPEDDPTGTKAFMEALTDVERVGDGSFKGTMDLTKSSKYAQNEALSSMSAQMKAIPFTAKVDGEGRLTEMTVDMSSLGASAGTMKTSYTDFGTEVKVEAPAAADVEEMPDTLSSMFGG